MQAELRAEKPDFNIEILGINAVGKSGGNATINTVGSLPWLQDAYPELIWDRWGVTHRDLRILDPQNRVVAIYNLSEHSLTVATNRTTLKQLFRNAAKAVDADNDGLPDLWETHYFQNIDPNPLGDGDGDGFDNFTEFALGTHPAFAPSRPWLEPRIIAGTQGKQFELKFRRFGGALANFSFTTSTNLASWTGTGSTTSATWPTRNLFDGTGNCESTILLPQSMPADVAKRFLRLRAVSMSPEFFPGGGKNAGYGLPAGLLSWTSRQTSRPWALRQ